MCPAEKLHLPVFLAVRHAHMIQFWTNIRIQNHLAGLSAKSTDRSWFSCCGSFRLFLLPQFSCLKASLVVIILENLAKRNPKALAVSSWATVCVLDLPVTWEKNKLSCWIHYYLGFQLHVAGCSSQSIYFTSSFDVIFNCCPSIFKYQGLGKNITGPNHIYYFIHLVV